MKVGILTFHWAYNYGAVLQAYGLYKVLKRLGHEVRFINYAPPSIYVRFWRGWGFRSGRQMPLHALRRLRFDWFRRLYLPESRRYRTAENLRTMAADFDAVIVGSDQVWNWHNFNAFDGTYFLDFIPNRSQCRRISYAACFGDPRQPAQAAELSGSLLHRFDFLSVRNKMSAELVRNFSDREAEVVLDPTMLYDYEELLAVKPAMQPYIAAYFLSHERIEVASKILCRIRERLQVPVVAIGADQNTVSGDKIEVSVGPSEWLRLLHGAAFICTNSFHGTIFAVKFQKPFIAWSTESLRGVRGPARINDFLGVSGLHDRLVETADSAALDNRFKTPIDYEVVGKKLSPHIDRSRSFLEKSLAT